MNYKAVHPILNQKNVCHFRVWAPEAARVHLELGNNRKKKELERKEFGYWETTVEDIEPGTRYRYDTGDGRAYPDPASLSQPEGVHGPSELIRLDEFRWKDGDWNNIPQSEMIIYELHTGTFSRDGDFSGVIRKLDYLKELGINTIELMPVAQFSGERNWGYDGVYPYAVHHSYGGAHKLMELVDACHGKGIAVLLDVVYNHLGPEGNYLPRYGPYFSDTYSTPWGKPLNFDGPYSDAVRNYFIQNAVMWCRDFHIDGLRLDAVHAIYDFSARHILLELAETLEDVSRMNGRPYYLVAESNLNDVRHITPVQGGGYALHAQWSDDFHHSVHTLATGEDEGYYMDFGKPSQLSKALMKGFVYDGAYSRFRKKTYGSVSEDFPGEKFVVFNQNHDQVGNRKHGERLISLAGFDMAKVVAGTTLLAPDIPLLFMGEEYGERQPFLYFVSHEDGDLNRQVAEGRKKEFESFHSDGDPAPDPASRKTFEESRLSWKDKEEGEHKAMFGFYRELISLRKNHPAMKDTGRSRIHVHESDKVYLLERWQHEERILAFLNFSREDQGLSVPPGIRGQLHKIIDSSSEIWNGPGEVSPDSVTANDQLAIPARSLVIYSNVPL